MKQERFSIRGGAAGSALARRQLTQRLPLTAFSPAARAMLKSPKVTLQRVEPVGNLVPLAVSV